MHPVSVIRNLRGRIGAFDIKNRRHQLLASATLLLLLLTGILVWRLTSGPGALAEVRRSGTITMITQNSATTYYEYRDEAHGFEYDFASAFADHLGVELEVLTVPWSEMFTALARGRGHFIAAGMTITPERREKVSFSDGYMVVQQHVVVHSSNHDIREVSDLIGETIHVRPGSSYEQRLLELKEGGLDIKLVERRDVPTEELIREVADRQIDITVADTNIARLNRRYYPEVRMAFAISGPQLLAWAVRPGSTELLEEINAFLDHAQDSGLYERLYRRYYANVQVFDYVDIKKFHERLETRLPLYKDTIQKEAKRFGFDWRLIAAMAYQESHYRPLATSYTGVRGLMQITRVTAREMGITNRLDPKQSIHAGVKYLRKLYDRLDTVPDGRERTLIALAAYNVGYGHVRDAQKLAEKRGLDPNRWSSLEKTLPLLRSRKYYSQTKHGYARGTEPVRYVDRILSYYDILRRKAVSS